MTCNNFLTTIEWREPDNVPDRSAIIMIVLAKRNGQWGDDVRVGLWDTERKIFRTLSATCDWEIENIEMIKCWAFWPHPPGPILDFVRELNCFEKVVKVD